MLRGPDGSRIAQWAVLSGHSHDAEEVSLAGLIPAW